MRFVKATGSVFVVCAVVMSSLVFLPSGVSATDIRIYYTPDATVYWPATARPPIVITYRGNVLEADRSMSTWGYIYAVTIYEATNGYEPFVRPGEADWAYEDGNESNLNFISVELVTYCEEVTGPERGNPNSTLSYSLDNRVTWHNSPLIAKDSGGFDGVYGGWCVKWNVTTEESWTPDMITASTTWVMFTAYLDDNLVPNEYYHVDYIGFDLYWNYTTGAPPGGENETAGTNLSLSMIGGLGLVGFGVMIACAPCAVYMWRNHEPRIRTFVIILMTFMFGFTMFLGSLGT